MNTETWIIDLQTYNLQNWYLTEKEISDEIIMNGLKDKKCYRLQKKKTYCQTT